MQEDLKLVKRCGYFTLGVDVLTTAATVCRHDGGVVEGEFGIRQLREGQKASQILGRSGQLKSCGISFHNESF